MNEKDGNENQKKIFVFVLESKTKNFLKSAMFFFFFRFFSKQVWKKKEKGKRKK